MRGWLAAAVLALLLAGWSIAEPFWLRPLLQHYVRTHAGRYIDFDGAGIRLNADWQPVLHLRHLQIENAPWAAARPLVTASEVEITIAWRSFGGGEGTVLPRVVFADADMDLEQLPDGLRNWRLANPQDRGPGTVRVLSLQAPRSRLRLFRPGRDLELELTTTPLPAEEHLAGRPDLPLTQTLQIRGTHRGAVLEGAFAIGAVCGLVDSGIAMPLRGRLASGGASLMLEGVARDLLVLDGFDVDAHLVGPNLAAATGLLFVSGALPALDADIRARLRKEGGHWAASDLLARIGRSDLAGSFQIDGRRDIGRPLLSGAFHARQIDVADLRRGFAGRSDAVIATTPARPDRSPPRRIDALDAELDLTAAKVSGLASDRRWAGVDGLQVHASSRQGQLTLAPLAFTIDGGAASGRLTVDSRHQPTEVALDLGVSNLRLDRWANRPAGGGSHSADAGDAGSTRASDRPGSPGNPGIQGGLNLRIALKSRGDSLAALRDHAGGQLSADLVQATLPASLAARLALDGGQWLRALASPGKQVAVTCSIAEMHLADGRGETTRLAIETDDVLVTGSARIDLKQKSYDLLLTPHRKQAALLALDKSVRLSGGDKRPTVGLVAPSDPAGPAGCPPSAAR